MCQARQVSSSAGVYGGISADQRRAERRARLLEAGLDLVGTEGWRAATVRAICARARLTPRYFYESFENREALLVAVFDGIADEAAKRVLESVAAAPDDAEAKSQAAVEAFVDMLVEDPCKARVAFAEAVDIQPLQRRRLQVLRSFADLIAGQARAFYGAPTESDRIIEATSLLLAGGLAELVMAWLAGELEATREELVEDCAALVAATGEAAIAIARRRAGRG